MKPKYINWLEAEEEIKLDDTYNVQIYNFNYKDDKEIMNEWAKRFRQHYCSDTEIDLLRDGTGLSREAYLLKMKFPDKSNDFGPATRSGDFAEILVADYLQYLLDFYVPRTRYDRKTVRNESTKGCDVIGLLIKDDDKISKDDTIKIFEVKATLSGNVKKNRLQDAVDDSVKDPLRLAESLNAIKQRLFDKKDIIGFKKVGRFQNKLDRPYKLELGAAAIITNSAFDKEIIKATNFTKHSDSLNLIVIRGEDMMNLVHDLYGRASRC